MDFRKFKIGFAKNEKAFYNFLELKDFNVDFPVKRVYFVQDFKQPLIGGHCHKIEKEVFILTKGNCVAIIDKGNGKEEIPFFYGDAMYVGNYVWHAFRNFSPGAIIFALSSTNYIPDRSDYVEDYEEYLKIRKSL